jgi:hypothetical protein
MHAGAVQRKETLRCSTDKSTSNHTTRSYTTQKVSATRQAASSTRHRLHIQPCCWCCCPCSIPHTTKSTAACGSEQGALASTDLCLLDNSSQCCYCYYNSRRSTKRMRHVLVAPNARHRKNRKQVRAVITHCKDTARRKGPSSVVAKVCSIPCRLFSSERSVEGTYFSSSLGCKTTLNKRKKQKQQSAISSGLGKGKCCSRCYCCCSCNG